MNTTPIRQIKKNTVSKIPLLMVLALQLVMDSALSQSLFTVLPSLPNERSEKIQSAIRSAIEEKDEAPPVPIKMDASVLDGEFITFAVPNGPTYLFHKTSITRQGSRLGWLGETQNGSVSAHFRRYEKGQIAIVRELQADLSLSTKYVAESDTSGIGIFRKVSGIRVLPPDSPDEGKTVPRRDLGTCPEFFENS